MFIFIFYFFIYALNFHILKGLVNLFEMRIPALHLLNTLQIFKILKQYLVFIRPMVNHNEADFSHN